MIRWHLSCRGPAKDRKGWLSTFPQDGWQGSVHDWKPFKVWMYHKGQESGGPLPTPRRGGMGACTKRKPLSVQGQGCCKGQKCREPLVSHGRIHLGAHHRSLQSLGHTKVKMLVLKVLLKKGNCGLLALGLKVGCSHFCFHPLEMHRRPAGNKTHMEKPVAAHTEPSLLPRGNATLPRQESAQ